jgi:hypothetical protein
VGAPPAQVAAAQPIPAKTPVSTAPSPKAQRSPLLAASVVGVVVLLGVALYFAFLRPQPGIANEEACVVGQLCADETPAAVDNEEGIPFPEVARVAVADAKARADAGNALFVDVRDEDSFAQAHIPGSVLIPLNEIEAQGSNLPIDRDIILYCT